MGADDRPIYSPMAWHLETERFVLNPFDATDAELYSELIDERGPGTRGFGTTVQGARDNIAKSAEEAEEAEESGIGLLAVPSPNGSDFICYCGLLVGRASIDEPEIAFELFRREYGQEYATEAAVAVIEAAKATGRRRLWSRSGPGATRPSESWRRPDSAGITPTRTGIWST
jgi:RimJ/RimL family protein N-acetyltransferase